MTDVTQNRFLIQVLTAISLIAACGLSGQVHALGLGEVALQSRLNEPLKVSVPITHDGGLTLSEMKAKIASYQVLQEYDIEPSYIHSLLKADIKTLPEGGHYVFISSHQPIKEPYLRFLVDLRWTGGKLLKEVTLLLDSPR